MKRTTLAASLTLFFFALAATQAPAQPPPPVSSSADDDQGFIIHDSKVGYIDSAIPADEIRLRYDTAYNNNVPSRGEYFYAALRRGLPRLESNVDYQDVSAYIEKTLGRRASVFVEAPVRFANFDVNPDHSGFADMNAGFKFAFFQNCSTLASAQLRAYFPTGDAHRGLGNDHVSLEPAVLLFHRLSDRLVSESEVRLWIPIGGTADFASNVVRYGTGLSYDVYQSHDLTISPVVEAVGWSFLDGKEARVQQGGAETILSAAGDTIINMKMGVRMRVGERLNIYGGYGRAVTGEVLYKDLYRVEFRFAF